MVYKYIYIYICVCVCVCVCVLGEGYVRIGLEGGVITDRGVLIQTESKCDDAALGLSAHRGTGAYTCKVSAHMVGQSPSHTPMIKCILRDVGLHLRPKSCLICVYLAAEEAALVSSEPVAMTALIPNEMHSARCMIIFVNIGSCSFDSASRGLLSYAKGL